MEKNFVVITEIYFKDEKISRSRSAKNDLSNEERNQLIRTLFNIFLNQKTRMMDVYSKISMELKEKFHIVISERSIMRILSEK